VPAIERLDPEQTASHQMSRLHTLLAAIEGRNDFYTRKLREAGIRRDAWVEEQHLRLTGGAITEYQVNMMVTFVIDD
jgi:hypothetical protein